MLQELTITIEKNSEGKWDYRVYSGIPEDLDSIQEDELDGGICTGSMKSAIDIACEMAHDCNKSRIPYSVKKEKENEKEKQRIAADNLCPECGSKETYKNSSGEKQCENCGYEENDLENYS